MCACVREVAARHEFCPSRLRSRRRQVREGRLAVAEAARFVPARMTVTAPIAVGVSPPVDERHAAETIEIAAPAGDARWLPVINPWVEQFNASGDNARRFNQ